MLFFQVLYELAFPYLTLNGLGDRDGKGRESVVRIATASTTKNWDTHLRMNHLSAISEVELFQVFPTAN